MKRIVSILIGLMIICNVGAVWAEPTVKEILQKKLANDQALQTFEAKLANKWEIINTNLNEESSGYIWVKGKDKRRTEIYQDDGSILQVQIANGILTAIIDTNGDEYQTILDTSTVTDPPAEIDVISEDVDKFLEYYTVTINISKSDLSNQKYCLELIPTIKSDLYQQLSKTEDYIDYNSGLEVKTIIYGTNSKTMVTRELSNNELINGVWIAKEKTSIFPLEDGRFIQNKVIYDQIKVNEGIDETKFYIEPVEK